MRRARACIAVTALALAGCGSTASQDAAEPSGNFQVQIANASFPATQALSEHSRLVLTVRNVSHQTIPDINATICNVTCSYPAPVGEGTSVKAFADYLDQPYLASHSRQVWVIDQPPGGCGYSCQNGGQGGATTAYSNTWALGPLAPGASASFVWDVTAVQAGKHVVAWEVGAGLNGKAKAVTADGRIPHGTFTVDITSAAPRSYVNNAGQVVSSSP